MDVERGQLLGSQAAKHRQACSRTSTGIRNGGGPGRREPAGEASAGPRPVPRSYGRPVAPPPRDSKWLLLEAALDRDQSAEDDGLGARALPATYFANS